MDLLTQLDLEATALALQYSPQGTKTNGHPVKSQKNVVNTEFNTEF